MKKKITAIALVICLMAVAIVGGSLAYFTDNDSATNVFTTGNVDIDLNEVFDPENAKLLPGIDVQKEVKVTNVGSENAFVRVHIAIPSMLDSGSEDEPQFAAYNNTLHFNMSSASTADGLWNWNKSADGANYPENGGNWNMYQETVDGVLYNVYVVTYETALANGQQTAENAIYKVYFDTKVTNELVTEILDELGEIKILVVAEGAQVAGFEGKAYEALNTQFGVPGTYNPFVVPAP